MSCTKITVKKIVGSSVTQKSERRVKTLNILETLKKLNRNFEKNLMKIKMNLGQNSLGDDLQVIRTKTQGQGGAASPPVMVETPLKVLSFFWVPNQEPMASVCGLVAQGELDSGVALGHCCQGSKKT